MQLIKRTDSAVGHSCFKGGETEKRAEEIGWHHLNMMRTSGGGKIEGEK